MYDGTSLYNEKRGIYCLNVENLKLNNVKFEGQIGLEYVKEESK